MAVEQARPLPDRPAPVRWAPLILGIALALGVVGVLATFSIVEEERQTRRLAFAILPTGFAALRLILPKRTGWDWTILVLFGALAALTWAYHFELVPDPRGAGAGATSGPGR